MSVITAFGPVSGPSVKWLKGPRDRHFRSSWMSVLWAVGSTVTIPHTYPNSTQDRIYDPILSLTLTLALHL